MKPMVFSTMNERCQVDLVDMQSNPDGAFKFIMVYQDHLTKFSILRPLRTKTAVEVAKEVLDIFCIFGAPSIMQSDNGREFVNSVIEELVDMWKGLKIVHGKPRHSQSQGSVEKANQDVQNMLMSWMEQEGSTHWSEGLKFVQFSKNQSLHEGIQRAPYRAMFGNDAKFGLVSTTIPKAIYGQINTEEDLQSALERAQPQTAPLPGQIVPQTAQPEQIDFFAQLENSQLDKIVDETQPVHSYHTSEVSIERNIESSEERQMAATQAHLQQLQTESFDKVKILLRFKNFKKY